MNPAGFIPIAVGLLLIFLGVTGRYRQSLEIITGRKGAGQAASVADTTAPSPAQGVPL
jgi:hypothetical protein